VAGVLAGGVVFAGGVVSVLVQPVNIAADKTSINENSNNLLMIFSLLKRRPDMPK
jgi:hypothetical protein